MEFTKIKLCGLVAILVSFSALSLAAHTFGEGADLSQVTKISEILATPDNYTNRSVTVEGTIVKVCKKRGCWVELSSDRQFQTFRVKVRDGDMVFPMTAMGKTAFATGKVQAIELNLQRTKQYLAYVAEEQAQPFDPNSVTEGMTLYQLVPTGVTIQD